VSKKTYNLKLVSSSISIHWSARSESGSRKPDNEDSLIVFASGRNGAEILPENGSHTLQDQDLIFAISDGMGGGNAGNIASALILKQMAEMIPQTFKAAAAGFFPDCLNHLRDALHEVHQQINAAADCAEKKGMAATLAIVWFTPENLYLANVGDSRIYRSRNGALEQLSRDHTYAWGQWKRGEISEYEYRSHSRRAALYEIVGGGHAKVTPHLAAIAYEPGDCFLICSDGLIDGLWERHLSTALAASENDLKTITENLLKRAMDNAGKDDTSLIVISATPQSAADC
jgi:PPM family protein phosphatase